MKSSAVIAIAAALLPTTSAQLGPRQDDGDASEAARKACYPDPKGNGPVAPCLQIENIGFACKPNGTEPLDYEAHAQCMCKGSYFEDWRGCQECLRVHGFQSERDNAYWARVALVASEALCTGTPTAAFQSLFASAESNTAVQFATTGNTETSDQFPGKTAVSLYYTPTVSQGPGKIEGSATEATAEQTPATTAAPDTSSSTTTSEENDNSTTSTTTDQEPEDESTTSSPNAAAPTQGPGIVAALAGAAMLAVL